VSPTDLIAELRAALDAEEAAVRALAEPHDWRAGPGDDPTWEDESTVYMWPPEFHTPYEGDKHWRGLTTSSPELAVHIARHDPKFVLADIAAKRKLIARGGPFCTSRCDDPGNEPMDPDTDWKTPLEHHLDCGAYEAAQAIAEAYGITA
jgi:hypothetical protein